MVKQILKKEEHLQTVISIAEDSSSNRQPSPELAKISALITRPPKLKSSKNMHDLTLLIINYDIYNCEIDIQIRNIYKTVHVYI